ncbi:30S ribosomal protein S1, partial [Candidatus Zixiibacteriota bacterium]
PKAAKPRVKPAVKKKPALAKTIEPVKPAVPETPPEPEIITYTYGEEEEYSDSEYSEMLQAYEETMRDIREGEIVRGKVIQVAETDILVDVGFKSEGVIPITEFGEPLNVKVGDEIDVYLENIENQDGQLVLSKQKADFMRVWDKIKVAYDGGDVVEGRLLRRIKGGMVVDLFGVDAFLPGSQVALRPVPDLDQLIGEQFPFKIIKLNKMRRNIVVSRRVVLEEERGKAKAQIITELEVGQIREGTVKNITDFGAFIDLGGIDGLLHITDMSWGRVSHPSELVAISDVLKVKVLNFEKERERISLGLKQLTPYPWENVEEKYPVNDKVRGKVVSITDYGAFVELEKGIEGLIHISEMSWTQHIRHPSKVVAIGDVVEVVVLKVDKEGEKISLGLKQIQPDPWLTLEERHPIGSRVTGRVRNLTNFGAFVEIEEGIDGLVHISDLSWTRRIHHPSEVLKKGDKVEVAILNVDKDNRRVSLGYKQLIEDPWEHLATVYPEGTAVNGKILRLLERGVIVELPESVEGFVPLTQLGRPDIHKPAEAFSVGEEIPLKVLEFDLGNRKIILSAKAYFEDHEKTELEEYLAKHPVKTLTMAEVAGAEEMGKASQALPQEEAADAEQESAVKEEEAKTEESAEVSAEEESPEPEADEEPEKASEEEEAAVEEKSSEADDQEAPEEIQEEESPEPEADEEPETEDEAAEPEGEDEEDEDDKEKQESSE